MSMRILKIQFRVLFRLTSYNINRTIDCYFIYCKNKKQKIPRCNYTKTKEEFIKFELNESCFNEKVRIILKFSLHLMHYAV